MFNHGAGGCSNHRSGGSRSDLGVMTIFAFILAGNGMFVACEPADDEKVLSGSLYLVAKAIFYKVAATSDKPWRETYEPIL